MNIVKRMRQESARKAIQRKEAQGRIIIGFGFVCYLVALSVGVVALMPW